MSRGRIEMTSSAQSTRAVLAVTAAVFQLSLAAPARAQTDQPAPPPPSYEEPPPGDSSAPPPQAPPNIPPPPQMQPLTNYAPAPPEVVPAGAERHDGFYLRAALGLAEINLDRSTDGALHANYGDGSDSSVAGPGGMGELSIGGTPWPGVVIAGSLVWYDIAEPKLERDRGKDADLSGPLTFAVLGATLDWYPNPHGGFHLGGTLGAGAVKAKSPDGSPFDDIGGAGAAFSLGIGYDWWVADEWSVGVLGRLSGARIHGEDTVKVGSQEITGSEDSSVSAVGVMFSLLYH